MGIVIMASVLTLTMLLEVMGKDTTMEDGLTIEVACSRLEANNGPGGRDHMVRPLTSNDFGRT